MRSLTSVELTILAAAREVASDHGVVVADGRLVDRWGESFPVAKWSHLTATRLGYSDDQPRDELGRFGEGNGSASRSEGEDRTGQPAAAREQVAREMKRWAEDHPPNTAYRAASPAEVASGTLGGTRGEVWVDRQPRDRYLDGDEVVLAIQYDPQDVIGTNGAGGGLKLRPLPASRVIDRFDPRARQAAFDPDQLRDERGRWATDPSSANVGTADALHAEATAREPGVTSSMEAIARRLGGRMQGLEFRLKTRESLSRKIDDKMREGLSRDQAEASINDALRYTMEFDEADYTEATVAALADLQEAGYEVEEIKNYWQPGDTYSGINAVLSDGDTRFEVQFHTPASFSTKMGSHVAYEEYRNAETPPQRRAELYGTMTSAWDSVPVPREIESFGTPVFMENA